MDAQNPHHETQQADDEMDAQNPHHETQYADDVIVIDDEIETDDKIETDHEMDHNVKNPHYRDTRQAEHQKPLLFPPVEALTTDL